jgi:hypothetical protein
MVLVKAKVVDSTHLELSRPLLEPQGTVVLISVAEPGNPDSPDNLDDHTPERQPWLTTSATSLSRAYDEGEPDYPVSLIQEGNPDYGK